MTTDIEMIRQVAEDVRDRCLQYAMSDASHGRDYHKSPSLGSMCAVASTVLAKEYRKTRIDPKAQVVNGTYDGMEHCWVKCCGLNVDITATQFGRNDVEIWKTNFGRHKWKEVTMGDPGTIAMDWGREQAPERSVLRKIAAQQK